MIRVIVEIEAAIDAGGVAVVAAGTLAIVAGLICGAGVTTFTAIGLVGLQIDTRLAAGIEAANTIAGLADLVRRTDSIAAATVRFIGLRIDARLIANLQRAAATLHAFSLEAEIVARLIATAAVHRVRVDVDADTFAGDLDQIARELAITRHTGLVTEAGVPTVAAVLGRALGVDANTVAHIVSIGAMPFTGPVHAKFVLRALNSACATVLEVASGIDACIATPPLESGTLDDTNTLLAHLIVETRLIAATAVDDVTIRADTGTVTVGLVRVGTALSMLREGIGEITVREIRVLFATAPCSK